MQLELVLLALAAMVLLGGTAAYTYVVAILLV